ncbi:MAG: aconitase X swivel domain-containing protein [Candidatus Hodarchaeota archaeon]
MIYEGNTIIAGNATGTAVVTKQSINFLAAYSKNLVFTWKKGKIGDKEHELFGMDLRDKILFVPSSCGSTTGGLFLLEAIKAGIAPKAIIVQAADSLLVSGAILAEIWLEGVPLPPIIECPVAFSSVETGTPVVVKNNVVEVKVKKVVK